MTESTDIDGIVPLQATSTALNALVINGIVSENGEVRLDPIVPLSSLSKVQPKLRPVLRLSSLGKSSVQVGVHCTLENHLYFFKANMLVHFLCFFF